MSVKYNLVGSEDGSVVTVWFPGRSTALTAHSSHPRFGDILEAILEGADEDTVVSIMDAAKFVSDKFDTLTERVSVANGRIYLDGDEVSNPLTSQVLRFIEAGVDDWKPLVKFFENVQANPNEHSREQLFAWLDRRDFTITEDGMIVGYKGVNSDLTSTRAGKAMVNGEVKTGNIPNPIGAVVEMPRSEVHHDPSTGCSTGLHVATHGYAKGYGNRLLEVHVNPRDVVSVPTDSNEAKVRVCRYVVIADYDNPDRGYSTPVRYREDYDDGFWGDGEDELCECGEYPEDCDCDDSIETPQTPKEFFQSFYTNVDNAWRAWNSDPQNTTMTRDEFRAAVK